MHVADALNEQDLGQVDELLNNVSDEVYEE